MEIIIASNTKVENETAICINSCGYGIPQSSDFELVYFAIYDKVITKDLNKIKLMLERNFLINFFD